MTIIAHSKQVIAIDDAGEQDADVTRIDVRVHRAASGWQRDESAAETEKVSRAYLSVASAS